MKKKKILIIAYYFPPDNNGGTERVKNFYYKLKNEKYETYVLTALKKGHDKKQLQKEDSHIIRIKLMWECFHAYYGFLLRYKVNIRLFYWLAYFFTWLTIRKIKPDICIASYPPFQDFDIGIMIKKMFDINVIADFRDSLMYESFEVISNCNEKQKKVFWKLEKDIAVNSDFCITAASQITDYLKKEYGAKAYTIWNGFDDTEEIDAEPIPMSEDTINILYTGALGMSDSRSFYAVKRCLEAIIQKNKDKKFYFLGDYTKDEKENLGRFENVVFHPKVPRQVAVATQRAADVLLLVTQNKAIGTTGKLFEYLFSDKPILNIGGMNNARRIIEETNAGVSFFDTEVDKINDFLKSIKKGECQFERRNLKQYTRREECKCFMNYITELEREGKENE